MFVFKPAAVVLSAALLVVLGAPAWAQDNAVPAPENRFLLTGYGFTTFEDSDSTEASFNSAFVPIFLYRISDEFLFEAEVEFEFEDEELETGLEYAQLDWLVNDRLTVVMGRFLTPFGTFIERIHPAWINKLPTFPLPYQHDRSLIPFNQTGLQLRGGVPLGEGNRRFNYSVFLSNGLRIPQAHGEEGTESEASEAGADDEGEELLSFGGASSNTGDLAAGGRISVVPARGFEIGISSFEGSYDDAGELDSSMTGFDFAYHHDLFDLRAEWLDTETDRLAGDGSTLPAQEADSWYLQASVRLSIIPVYALNKVEAVGRFANLAWAGNSIDQTSFGINYYFTGSTVLRAAWERTEESERDAENAVIAMFAVGF